MYALNFHMKNFFLDEMGLKISSRELNLYNFLELKCRSVIEEYDYTNQYLLAAAVGRDEEILVVRGLRVLLESQFWSPGEMPSKESVISIDPLPYVTGRPESSIPAYDIPIPLGWGLLDEAVVWVSTNPLDAALLRSIGIAATSLVRPFGTLGWPEGLANLRKLGALTTGDRTRGLLVVTGDSLSLTSTQCRELGKLFSEVWRIPELTGRKLHKQVARVREEAGEDDGASSECVHALLHYVREKGEQLVPTSTPRPGNIEAAADTKKTSRRQALSGRELLASSVPPISWLVDGFIPDAALTELQGSGGAGKTTFLLSMAVALGKGEPFMGMRCERTRVLLVTEHSKQSIKSNFADTPGCNGLQIHFVPSEEHIGKSWEERYAHILNRMRQCKAEIVILDTLANVTTSKLINDQHVADRVISDLKKITASGVAVMIIRHGKNKRDAPFSTTAKGPESITTQTDRRFRLTKLADRNSRCRILEYEGHMGSSGEAEIELGSDNIWRWNGARIPPTKIHVLNTNIKESKKQKSIRLVRQALEEDPESWLSVDELLDLTKVIANRDRGGGDEVWSPKGTSVRNAIKSMMSKLDMHDPADEAKKGHCTYRLRLPPPPDAAESTEEG